MPYINRSKVRADGTTAVLCRITIDGKQTAISTGIYCRPEDWNGRKNEIKTVRENNRLREYLRLTEEAYTEILKSQGVVSAEMLKNHISLNNIHPTTLLQMGEWERERLKKHSEEIDSTSSYRHSMYYQKYLTDFIASIGKKEIPLEEVTEDFGKSYKAFLKKCKNFSSSQTNKCMCWLNRLLSTAKCLTHSPAYSTTRLLTCLPMYNSSPPDSTPPVRSKRIRSVQRRPRLPSEQTTRPSKTAPESS